VTNTFLRDGAYVTDPVVKDSNATYTPGISERRSGTTKHLSHNLKSVDSQVTTGQSVAASRLYDAFGNVTSSTGTFVGPFGYGGGFGYQEEATGLKLLGHRLYDSSTGRFLTRDPIKDGRNWYVYCENDPVDAVDRDGCFPVNLNQYGAMMEKGLSQLLHEAGEAWDRFWHGDPRTDPEGKPVRVGGWAIPNPKNNAMTLPPGQVHIHDDDDWEFYVSEKGRNWRNHEHRHLEQIEEMGDFWYLVEIIREYVTTFSHDNAPLEIDADNWRDDKEWRNPFPCQN